jgi:hypothetical protein
VSIEVGVDLVAHQPAKAAGGLAGDRLVTGEEITNGDTQFAGQGTGEGGELFECFDRPTAAPTNPWVEDAIGGAEHDLGVGVAAALDKGGEVGAEGLGGNAGHVVEAELDGDDMGLMGEDVAVESGEAVGGGVATDARVDNFDGGIWPAVAEVVGEELGISAQAAGVVVNAGDTVAQANDTNRLPLFNPAGQLGESGGKWSVARGGRVLGRQGGEPEGSQYDRKPENEAERMTGREAGRGAAHRAKGLEERSWGGGGRVVTRADARMRRGS